MSEKKIDIYKIREKGKELCNTDGSEHYHNEIEPIELTIALGYGEGFCIGSILKYAARYKETQNIKDLKKIADYSHILAGINALEDKD